MGFCGDNVTTFSIVRDILLEGNNVTVAVNGQSMLPFFRSGSTITIRPIREDDFKKYSVVFADAGNHFVIHRVISIDGEMVTLDPTFKGKTVYLNGNVDLATVDANGNRVSFDPIGYGYDVYFSGTFDGQGYTISNLYQDGGDLGYERSTAGGGLFASVKDATIKNVNIDNAEIVMNCIDMGILVGYSYGECTYENISVTNSSIANYQRYTGGVVGEVNGKQTFKNLFVVLVILAVCALVIALLDYAFGNGMAALSKIPELFSEAAA